MSNYRDTIVGLHVLRNLQTMEARLAGEVFKRHINAELHPHIPVKVIASDV